MLRNAQTITCTLSRASFSRFPISARSGILGSRRGENVPLEITRQRLQAGFGCRVIVPTFSLQVFALGIDLVGRAIH